MREWRSLIVFISIIWCFPLSALADWVSPGDGTVYTMQMVDELTDDVTWQDEGYYLISGNLTISANDKLVINPGMVLKFEEAIGLTINGALEVCGKPDELISFTDAGGEWPWTAWRGIEFNDTCVDSECILSYCVVEHTGSSEGIMIWISNASPTISHCKLMWTSSQVETGGVLVACDSSSFPVIEYSFLRSGMGAGVFCHEPANPLLLENDIIFTIGWNCGSHTIMGGGFLDGNYLECEGNIDTTLGFPVDTVGDGDCTTNSTEPTGPQFWEVDGVRNPRSRPHNWVPSDDEIFLPGFFALGQNYPNPFNSGTVIPYHLPSPVVSGQLSVPTTLRVYNILGQVVRTLVDGPQESGEHRVVWDGRDDRGKEVSSGIYLCLLRAENRRRRVLTNVRKLMLVR